MGKIIVTGGSGYIGSHTIIELLENTGHDIVSIDNFSNSDSAQYDRIRKIVSRSFQTIEADVCDYTALNEKLKDVNDIVGIIHFAAFKSVPESIAQPLMYYQNNLGSLQNILKFCKERSIKNFIFSSSCSVYGNADKLPVTEQTPLSKAESPYAHTKRVGEEVIEFFCKSRPEFNAVILRYFNPAGAHHSGLIGEVPVQRPNNLVPVITQTASGKNKLTVFGSDYPTRDGSCIRDYIHVSDIARAHVNAFQYLEQEQQKSPYSVFNLGTGNGITVFEAIKAFEKVSAQKLNYNIGGRRDGDVIAVYANNDLAKAELKWSPKFSIEDMMSTAWKWQQHFDAGN